MGLEAACRGVIDGKAHSGRLHVDSKEIAFSSPGVKWKHPVGAGTKARVTGGRLEVGSGKKLASFELGDDAGKWLEKVLHPPSRLKKLGVKPGQMVFLKGAFPGGFVDELVAGGAGLARTVAACTLALALVKSTRELAAVDGMIERLSPGASIWIVWPKGTGRPVSQSGVMELFARHAMGPGKTCAFDDELSALRFTRKK